MPKDKTQSHQKITDAAEKEFLKYGFKDASMRRIASEAGITVSGLYKHFQNKEEMFASLVDPVIEEMMNSYRTTEEKEFRDIEEPDPDHIWEGKQETQRAMKFIYDHINEFRLLVCRSQGTRYADIAHEIALMEEETTLRYMETLKNKGIPVKDVNRKEFHLLVTTNINAILQAVVHDFTREEAMHYAETLEDFYMMGWRNLFGI